LSQSLATRNQLSNYSNSDTIAQFDKIINASVYNTSLNCTV